MIDLIPIVLQALESNPALVSLIGHDRDGSARIYQLVAPYADDFPRITFFEMSNFDSDFADDEAIESRISFQIDIWSKESPVPIAKEVDRAMKDLGFRRTSTADLYEDDVNVYHKGMRYTIAVNAAE